MNAPKGWQRLPIKNVYKGLFDGPHATPPIADDGPVFLGIKNITDDGHLALNDVRHIAEEDFARWTKRVTPQAGDIVFTYEATLNRYARIPEDFRGCLGRRLALIRPNDEVVDPRFLHFYFFGQDWRETIEANKLSGATVDRIPLTGFPNFPINLPPLPAQKRIASILSAYDDLIENNMRRIAILEEMARRLYEEWFVHFRFPGHEDATFIETEDGRVPEGWNAIILDDLVEDIRQTIQPYQVDQSTPYVGLEHIPRRSTTLSEWGTADSVDSTKLVFRKGDILFGKIRPYFHKVCIAPIDGICSSDTILLRARKEEFSSIALCCTSSDAFVQHATQTSNGTKMPRANWNVLKQYPVAMPPEPILTKFNKLIIAIVAQTNNLMSKNRNLRAQRDLLLPKLISGEIDVSKAEEVVGGEAA